MKQVYAKRFKVAVPCRLLKLAMSGSVQLQ